MRCVHVPRQVTQGGLQRLVNATPIHRDNAQRWRLPRPHAQQLIAALLFFQHMRVHVSTTASSVVQFGTKSSEETWNVCHLYQTDKVSSGIASSLQLPRRPTVSAVLPQRTCPTTRSKSTNLGHMPGGVFMFRQLFCHHQNLSARNAKTVTNILLMD